MTTLERAFLVAPALALLVVAPVARAEPPAETEGLTPGFVLRVRYTPAFESGTFDRSNVGIHFIDPVDIHVGLGGRLRVAERLSLTLEGDLGLAAASYLVVTDFTDAEAAKLGAAPDPANAAGWVTTSQSNAIGTAAFYGGPAVSVEVLVSPGLALYARPRVLWGTSLPVLQKGKTHDVREGRAPDPDGFLDEKTYTLRAFSIELGAIFLPSSGREVSTRRHWTVGVGWRTTNFAFSDLPNLPASGVQLAIGTTS
jgi:hypothetical protein